MRRVVLAAAVAGCLGLPVPALAGTLFLIRGAGWGNGLGMSQWGAQGFALHGWDYRGILAHYYPQTRLAVATDRSVRVQVASKQQRVRVGSSAPFLLVDGRGRRVHVQARTLTFGVHLRLGQRALVPPVLVEPGAQPLALDGAGYRGTLTLLRSEGALSVVNTVSIELYLRGVVPSEMPGSWLTPAYQAQAVAARSYAFSSLDPAAPFDLYADGRSQVYAGIDAEKPTTNDAISGTAGQVLTYEGRVVRAYYDSDSGGRTAAVTEVFAGSAPRPYLVSVSDPYDSISPYRSWRVALSAEQLSSRLGASIEDVRVEHADSGVATRVVLRRVNATTDLTAHDFAQRLGLRSLRFSISVLSLSGATPAAARTRTLLHGFLRGIAGVVLQARLGDGSWHQVAHIHARPDGTFELRVRRGSATAYRLAVDRVAGPPLELSGSPARRMR
jgi:stage II sporulation protein D